jgi:hypothetical protein
VNNYQLLDCSTLIRLKIIFRNGQIILKDVVVVGGYVVGGQVLFIILLKAELTSTSTMVCLQQRHNLVLPPPFKSLPNEILSNSRLLLPHHPVDL